MPTPANGRGAALIDFSVEVSVYLDAAVARRGFGTRLYQALFSTLRERGVHVAMGGIAQPNPASVALHEKNSACRKSLISRKSVSNSISGWTSATGRSYYRIPPEASTNENGMQASVSEC
ncbi:GNAT family N-acetyltransferase [Undibacterium arcticum]